MLAAAWFWADSHQTSTLQLCLIESILLPVANVPLMKQQCLSPATAARMAILCSRCTNSWVLEASAGPSQRQLDDPPKAAFSVAAAVSQAGRCRLSLLPVSPPDGVCACTFGHRWMKAALRGQNGPDRGHLGGIAAGFWRRLAPFPVVEKSSSHSGVRQAADLWSDYSEQVC